VSGDAEAPRFEDLHRPLAMLAHAIAGRPLRLVPCALPATAARRPPPSGEPGTLRVPDRVGTSMPRGSAERMLRLGVLRQALAAEDGGASTAAAGPQARGAGGTRLAPRAHTSAHRPTHPVLLARVLALLEGARIDARLRRRCPGATADLEVANAIARTRLAAAAPGGAIRMLIRALALEAMAAHGDADSAPAHGGRAVGARALLQDPRLASLHDAVLDEVEPLRAPHATHDAARAAARRIVARIEAAAGPTGEARTSMLRIVAPDADAEASGASEGASPGGDGRAEGTAEDGDAGTAEAGTARPAGAVSGTARAGEGLGAAPQGAVLAEPPADDAPALDAFGRPRRVARIEPAPRPPPGGVLHDEWDWTASRYLRAWCRVNESRLRGTATGFGDDVRARHPELWRALRRRLAVLRPSGRRRVRGVGDGDELDLDGLVASVLDRRAGHASDERAYVRRDPVVRDVAAAFLVDMSASTAVALPDPDAAPRDAPEPAPWVDTGALLYGLYDDPPEPARGTPRRRVIDVAKDALALMADTLAALGDACALYGFSGDGRDNVEFLVAKAFEDPLNGTTWAALAAMEPRGSTRMGAAIRHATAKLARQPASTRLLVVVSDGYPQDSDYGPDRLDPEYGIRDTARALADASRAGVVPFCVTIDPGGHDYLRRMCAPNRYRVIDDVPALPAALAGIYAELSGRG